MHLKCGDLADLNFSVFNFKVSTAIFDSKSDFYVQTKISRENFKVLQTKKSFKIIEYIPKHFSKQMKLEGTCGGVNEFLGGFYLLHCICNSYFN